VKFFKYSLMISLLLSFANADSFTHLLSRYNTDVLPKGAKSLQFEYQVTNDDVDIFGIKSKKTEQIESAKHSFGDLKGYRFSFFYGVSETIGLRAEYTKQEIEIFSKALKREYSSFEVKKTLFTLDNLLAGLNRKRVVVALGANQNKLEDFKLQNSSIISRIMSDFSSDSISLSNNVLSVGDGSKYYVSQMPYFKLNNMKDSSYYAYISAGNIIDNFRYDYYVGFMQTHIDSDVEFVSQNEHINSIVKPFKLDLSRDEYRYFYGIVGDFKYKSFVFEAEYKRDSVNRSKGLNDYWEIDSYNFAIGYKSPKRYYLYSGFTYLPNQFAANIPVFYNEFTQSSFDNEYAIVYFGGKYWF